MDKQFGYTVSMALAYVHGEMMHFLSRYQQGKLQDDFFFSGMRGLISLIDNIVRENGYGNCNYKAYKPEPHDEQG